MAEEVGRTAVIGGGLAGLAAARSLAAAGVDVVVFDKGRAPGGRCSTRRSGDLVFDHGAQYFTCRDAEFARMLAPLRAAGAVAPWQGRIRSLERGRIAELRQRTERLVGVPGMSQLAREWRRGLAVVSGRRIERVERVGQRWRLHGAGESELFEAAVVAVPAPQAVSLLQAVPRLCAAVEAVRMLPCWAALLHFQAPLEVPFDGAFISGSPLSWAARNNSKPSRPESECWVLHATEAWSRSQLRLSPDRAGSQLADALGAALGRSLPPIAWSAAHRWLYASTDRPLGRPFGWDAQLRVGVCGDWAEGGRVEGAVLSGSRLGSAICGGRSPQ